MAKALLAIALWLSVAFSVLAAAPQKKQPSWAELTREQRQVLAPLASDWDGFGVRHKRTWLGIAKRYPSMTQEEQAKVQRKMRPWAKLKPAQRRAARKSYRKLQALPPAKRQTLRQKWEEYQRLPEAQRRQLEAAGKAPKAIRKSRAKSRPKSSASVPAPLVPAPAK